MGALIPSTAGGIPGVSLSFQAPRIPVSISYKYFFDRQLVKNTLQKAVHAALYKSGSIVMQTARRSIKRRGMARPKLKVMRENPDASLRDLIAMSEASGRRRDANQLRIRLRQIVAKDKSLPGSPPHTHKGNLRDKPGIVYAFDPTSESVVVGQGSPSIAWLASLHEFGGRETMQGWAWLPRWKRSYRAGIIGYWRVGTTPKNSSRWAQTKFRETFAYPARPYMRPAIARAIATRDIVKQFENKFRVGGV
jgi:hypothetical protein